MKQLVKIQEKADGKRVVSARDMYLGLGLNITQWKRWANKNIENNPFAVYGLDWVVLDIMSSDYTSFGRVRRGNFSKDYILTLDFAKKLCMLARTEKGEEVRNYFIEVEKKLAIPQIIDVEKFQELEAKVKRLEAVTSCSGVSEFSVMGYSGYCGKKIYGHEAVSLGKSATKKCKELGLPIGRIRDVRYGFVHTYPETILKQTFEEFFKLPRF